MLLAETAQTIGLSRALSAELAPWRKQWAIHDPGKVAADLAVTLAAGDDCLADLAVQRGQQELFGPVASDPTVSRLVAGLAEGVSRPWAGRRPRTAR